MRINNAVLLNYSLVSSGVRPFHWHEEDSVANSLLGSKHWPMPAQQRLWAWVTPLIPKFLGSNVKTDTLMIWTSFLEVRYLLPS